MSRFYNTAQLVIIVAFWRKETKDVFPFLEGQLGGLLLLVRFIKETVPNYNAINISQMKWHIYSLTLFAAKGFLKSIYLSWCFELLLFSNEINREWFLVSTIYPIYCSYCTTSKIWHYLSNTACFYWWQSKLEFQLRLQEFIELVRAENNLRAITYAQKYLAPWGNTYMKELQRVFVTVAYKSTTECGTYKVIIFSLFQEPLFLLDYCSAIYFFSF